MDNLLYNALMLGRSKNIANEEYSVAEGKKQPAAFQASEKKVNIDEVDPDALFCVTLNQTKRGYLEIEAGDEENLLIFEKKIITSEDFRNGKFKFYFRLNTRRIHDGNNFTCLIFKTIAQEVKIFVTIKNKVKVMIDGEVNPRKVLIKLTDDYLQLRMERLGTSEWVKKGLRRLSNISGDDERSLGLMLFKAQLYITKGSLEEAKNLMDYVGLQLPRLKYPSYELNCYRLYVKSLFDMDDEQAAEALRKIQLVYMQRPTWQIQWLLFYMDYGYANDSAQKLEAISDLYYGKMNPAARCTSPIMYYEALEIFRARPELLTRPGAFEIQILNFGLKQDFLTPGLCGRFISLLQSMDAEKIRGLNTEPVIRLLKAMYAKNKDTECLRALTRVLVAVGSKKHEDNIYYEKELSDTLAVSGVVDYYIYSIDFERTEPIAEKVLDYFAENQKTFFAFRSFFFANIILNKNEKPLSYKKYIDTIAEYAAEQAELGIVDAFTGIICKDLIENDKATQKLKDNLLHIVCTKEVRCKNPRIESVLVFHNEFSTYQEAVFEDGRAFVRVYSRSAVVLFKDRAGNVYYNIEHEIKDVLDTAQFIGDAIKDAAINKYMLLEDTLPILREYKDPVAILRFISTQFETGVFRKEYERKLLRDVMTQFARNSEHAVYDELLEFKKFNLDDETRGKLVEIMIARTLYQQAYDEIAKIGYAHVGSEYIAKLAHVLTELSNYTEADPLLLKLCEEAFKKTPFDPVIFDYLEEFYDDDIEVLISMYRAAAAYQFNKDYIAERIIKRAVETNANPDGTSYVFEKYFQNGKDEELKKKYLTLRALNYLYNNDSGDVGFFKYIENGLILRKRFDDRVYIAYLFYVMELESLDSVQTKLAETILKDLVCRGIMLYEFKGLGKYIELPPVLSNTVIISKTTKEHDPVPEISFRIMPSGSEEVATEKMKEIFKGCYTKYFTLFYNDVLTYKIDDEPKKTIHYKELHSAKDETRYSALDSLIGISREGSFAQLNEAAKAYYVKNRLVDRVFENIRKNG